MQMPLWAPDAPWRPPRASDLPDWGDAKRVAIDVETCDPQLKQLGIGVRRDGYVAGVSFAIEDGPSHYLPIAHALGDNMDPVHVRAYLRDQASKFKGLVVGANLSYDLDYLWSEEVHFLNAAGYRDVLVADPLIYELHRSYSLDAVAGRWGLPGKDEDALRAAARAYGVDPKGGLWRLPARHVGAYATRDAELPLQILRRQERAIEEADLWDIYELESRVLPVLVRMRRRGVRVDFDRLEQVEAWSRAQGQEALEAVRHATGVQLRLDDVWKADALALPLRAIGVDPPTTPKTKKPSVDKALLGSIDHDVARKLLWARKVDKLRTTFAASVRRYAVGDRIHCTFNQIAREDDKGEQKGARFGRLSAVDPNLQQQPSRDEFAEMWRSIYVADEGGLWVSADYSQQEPRWTTHFAALLNLPGAREAAKAYREDPKLDNHDFMTRTIYQMERADDEALFEKRRKAAKCIYLGLCYGEGGAKLCRELGLPTRWAHGRGRGRDWTVAHFDTREEALRHRAECGDGRVWEAAGEEGQKILDQFNGRAPFISMLAKAAEKRAREKGCIRTAGGRRLNFPQKDDGTYDWCHKSLNRVIQGTSADQTKMAIVEADRAGLPVSLQVHDELGGGSFQDKAQARELAELMADVLPAQVPFRVDLEVGPSWGEAA